MEDNICLCMFQNGKWTIYAMFNAGGLGQGSRVFPLQITSHGNT